MDTRLSPLKVRFEQLIHQHPTMRLRDAAATLQVSEAELIEAQVTGTAVRLKPLFQEILLSIPGLGHVMALTRNESVVHERKGTYRDVSFSGHVGLVLGEDIDLRLFLHAWKFAFAVEDGRNTSLQFFNGHGTAVHKIFLQPESNHAYFHVLVSQFREETPIPVQITPVSEKKTEKPDTEIDVLAFQESWRTLRDTHDFFPLLQKFKVSRTQALRLAPEGFVQPITLPEISRVMEKIISEKLEIMVFVGNQGCIQIHTGPIQTWKPMGTWWNVLDPHFNLHLRGDHVDTAYMVKKPTVDGLVTSLELFDAQGDQIVQFFGKRKPGVPELSRWRGILQECL